MIPLRDTVKTVKVGSGSITVTVKGQKARLSPGMVALPTTRNAWVTGAISVKLTGADADAGTIEAGYAVGCQVQVGDASVGVNGTADSGVGFDSSKGGNPLSVSPSLSAETGGSLSLAAGQVGVQSLTFDRATWPKPGDEIKPRGASFDPSTSFDFKGGSGSFNYADQTIGVDGCGGYAQARLYVIVTAQIGDSEGTVLAWGDRFTLG
ncbi:MspA family porin [Tsukamurella sputi]|uniref:MspA family porin n=1 Tax=Tsukamurella sputi TaxID=2591848 RepID=UPI001E2BCA79|nr:MspA family porin [Tsukamurella sputi]